MELEYEKVPIYVSHEIREIKMTKGNFVIFTNKDSFSAKKVVIATGLLASPKTGSDGSFFDVIKGFGHHFVKIVPALVQLQAKQSFFKSLAGIRAEMQIRLYIDGKKTAEEKGELQLTERGISGIPAFQISRFATRALQEMRTVFALIDFAPMLQEEELYEIMQCRFGLFSHGKNCNDALIGMFNKKLNEVLIKESGISPARQADSLSEEELRRLCKNIKEFRVDIIGSNGFDAAQVCAGGVDTSELYNDTLESRLIPGIYFAGEVIDIDGTCGGYNLQWAWSSGYVAGKSAAMTVRKNKESLVPAKGKNCGCQEGKTERK
jgi:predicted Rossmann fold flavoprotein